jgi:hypothetical protein
MSIGYLPYFYRDMSYNEGVTRAFSQLVIHLWLKRESLPLDKLKKKVEGLIYKYIIKTSVPKDRRF